MLGPTPPPTLPSLVRVIILAACSLGGGAHAQTIRELGSLPGTTQCGVFDVSADGTVVVGTCSGGGLPLAGFRWTASTGMVAISGPGGVAFEPYAVNSDGTVVVGYSTINSLYHAVRWTTTSGPQDLGVLRQYDTQASAVSADGSVVVGADRVVELAVGHPFRWTSTGMVDLIGGTPFSQANATCVSADGSVVVGWGDVPIYGDEYSYRWTSGAGVELMSNPPGLHHTRPRAASADGSIIVGEVYVGGEFFGYIWRAPGSYQILPPLAGDAASLANGVSADGSVVVGSSGPGRNRPYFWNSARGMTDLASYLMANGVDLSNWDLTFAWRPSVSADGLTIVGNGVHMGMSTGWIVTLPASSRCGSADFNHDGDSGTDADIEDFFACLAGNCCATCDSADFNGDGDTGTDADIEAFFRVLAGGPC